MCKKNILKIACKIEIFVYKIINKTLYNNTGIRLKVLHSNGVDQLPL